MRGRAIAASLTLTGAFAVAPASAAWTFFAGTGNYYQVVVTPQPITWPDAQNAAVNAGGYLATLTSQAENDFVFSLALAQPDAFGTAATFFWGPWLGGLQPDGLLDPNAGWTWVNGEGPFVYTNWTGGEPNDFDGDETRLHFDSHGFNGTWNDNQPDGEAGIFSYVIESPVPEPGSLTLLLAASVGLLGLRRRGC